MSLGNKIYELRIDRGLTLEDLAKAVGTSKGYIWELENSHTRKPSFQVIIKIARALKTTLNKLAEATNENQ